MEQGLKYEWNWPIRIDHWIRVTAVTVLVFTGFYIHWPFIAGGPDGLLMAWIRFSHKDYRKYNPLQALAYLFIGLVIIFTAITGAALYKGMAFGLINTTESFRWVNAMS